MQSAPAQTNRSSIRLKSDKKDKKDKKKKKKDKKKKRRLSAIEEADLDNVNPSNKDPNLLVNTHSPNHEERKGEESSMLSESLSSSSSDSSSSSSSDEEKFFDPNDWKYFRQARSDATGKLMMLFLCQILLITFIF